MNQTTLAIDQVDSPAGTRRRLPVSLNKALSDDFDGIIHWARDTEIYPSIIRDLVPADIPSAAPPELPQDWIRR